MKKTLLLLASAALLLVGCAKETFGPGAKDGEMVSMTVTASVQGEELSKAVIDNDGKGVNANRCIMVLYYADKVYGRYVATVSGYHATFDVTVPAKRTYKAVFWADCAAEDGGDLYYNTADLKNITLKTAYVGNDDKRDAFFCCKEYTVENKNQNFTATLTRPFAQLNIISTDIQDLHLVELYPKKVNLSFNSATSFNAMSGECGTSAAITYETDVYKAYDSAKTQLTLSMDYLFASAEQGAVDIDFKAPTEGELKVEYSFANIPYQRNYRTNIIGNLLTADAHWDVTINPDWNTPEYFEELWAAGMITPVTPVEDVYTINRPSELAWIAQQVNAGNTFTGKTVKLAKDIDLNNGAWTPMGNVSGYPGTAFMGTLDGNNHKILNLNCSDNTKKYASAALIGTVKNGTIKDLTIENVKVSSTHYAAALVGYVADGIVTIENCKVKNGTITSTPEWLDTEYDNGDKIGGLLGYGANACAISGCSVEGLTIKAYRDLGGIAGATKCAEIKDNHVKDCTITADQTVNFYDISAVNAGAIVGRPLEGTVDESNTAENVVVNYSLSDGLSFNPEAKMLIVSSANGLDALRNNLSPKYMNKVISIVSGDGVQSNLYCIKLANDITLTDAWTTISLAADQSIELDGNNKTISGLMVSGQEYAGLFTSRTAYYNSFTAKDLTISGAQITGTSTASDVKDDYAGAFLACAGKRATLANCSVVNSSVSNSKRMGAMMGMNNGPESVEFSNLTVSSCTITGVYDATGGVFGHMQTYANVLYKNVVVTETEITVPSGKTFGGIVGRVGAEGETYTFKNCSFNGQSTKEDLCGQVLNGSQVVIQND